MKKKLRPKLPDGITDDPDFFRRFKVELAEAVAGAMNESEWKKFAVRFGLEDEILEHPRFLRSLHWGDADYEGRVLDLLDHLCSANVPAILHLVEIPEVQRKLDDEFLAAWNGEADPLVSALSHSLGEVDATNSIVDLGNYTARVEAALPGDPYLAIGATKDLLEATMRTILDQAGVAGIEKLKFPELTNTCFKHLGLAPDGPPSSESEKRVRQISDGV